MHRHHERVTRVNVPELHVVPMVEIYRPMWVPLLVPWRIYAKPFPIGHKICRLSSSSMIIFCALSSFLVTQPIGNREFHSDSIFVPIDVLDRVSFVFHDKLLVRCYLLAVFSWHDLSRFNKSIVVIAIVNPCRRIIASIKL